MIGRPSGEAEATPRPRGPSTPTRQPAAPATPEPLATEPRDPPPTTPACPLAAAAPTPRTPTATNDRPGLYTTDRLCTRKKILHKKKDTAPCRLCSSRYI